MAQCHETALSRCSNVRAHCSISWSARAIRVGGMIDPIGPRREPNEERQMVRKLIQVIEVVLCEWAVGTSLGAVPMVGRDRLLGR
jgi:hypothetical protein